MIPTGTIIETAQAILAVAQVIAIALLRRTPRNPRRRHGVIVVFAAQLGCFGVAGAIALAFGYDSGAAIAVVLGATLLCTAVTCRSKDFRPAGAMTLTTVLMLTILLQIGALFFLLRMHASGPTTVVLWTVSIVYGIALPSSLFKEYEGWEALLRVRWRRIGQHPRRATGGRAPMVSIQVPIHAEPPDVVVETLAALARLDYPHYEVVVVDNNTTDEKLWRPVERRCAELGFRFLHVEGIGGAKAGALNIARPHIDPRATLIAVVDADYVADPQWLTCSVGYFDDLEVGFVQCPHAYRNHESASFTTMANTEYERFFSTEMMTLDEHGAGITVGTMSVIRLSALDAVGGWAEWCVTEDSELAIRIHAAGFSSVYLDKAYGWGLIPQTFAGYKKQRFRWAYGPCQEFAAHMRLFLPGPWSRRSDGSRKPALTLRQRLHHGNHGWQVICKGIRMLGTALVPVAVLSIVVHGESIGMTATFLVAAVVSTGGVNYLRWSSFREFQRASLREFLMAQVATYALTYTVTAAALTSIAGRSIRWERTDKFRRKIGTVRLFRSCRPETVLAVLFLTFGVIDVAAQPLGIMALFLGLVFLRQAFIFGMAPVLSYIAGRDMRARTVAPARAAAPRTVRSEHP